MVIEGRTPQLLETLDLRILFLFLFFFLIWDRELLWFLGSLSVLGCVYLINSV